MNALKLTHIIIPLLLAFLFIYFILFLNHIFWLSIFLIAVFVVFFILYSLSIYALFHKSPGYETYQNSQNKMDVQKIGYYKQNGRRMHQLLLEMREDITYEKLKQLQQEYIRRYQQESFCETCQIIKTPRTYHCKKCGKCVLRRQKHSDLINLCIGDRNMKIFMQYLFISMFLSLFMTLSLILITTLEHHKLKDFSDLQLILFALMEMSMGGSVLLFGKQFLISYSNAIDNITETQHKIGVITKKNNPFSSLKYYEALFKTRLEYLKLQDIADPSHWLELQEQN